MNTITLKKQSVKTMAWFFQTIGIDVLSSTDKRQITWKFFLFHFALLFTTAGIILFAFTNRRNFEEAIIIAAFLGSMIIIDIAIPDILRNKNKIRKLLFQMDDNIFTYSDETEIHVKYNPIMEDSYSRKLTILIFCYVCFGFSLSGVSPFIGLYLTGKFKTVIYPAWYPWKEDDVISSSITYSIQMVTSTCVFWSYYLFQMYAIYVIIEFLRQYKRLCQALRTMNDRTQKCFLKRICANGEKCVVDDINHINYMSSNFSIAHRKIYNDIYRRKLIDCVMHHQRLLKSFNLFKQWFNVLFSVELATSMVTFALVFYNLLQMTNYERSFTIVGSSFNVMTNLFSRCVVGEIFSEMNAMVTDTIFHEVNWYDQVTSNRQLLTMLHFLTKRPNIIFAFSLFECSFLTFARITRASYSYFNIIRTTLNTK